MYECLHGYNKRIPIYMYVYVCMYCIYACMYTIGSLYIQTFNS